MPALPMFTSLHTEAQVALNEAMFATGHGVELWKLSNWLALCGETVRSMFGTFSSDTWNIFPVLQTVWLDWELKTLGSQRL
jgi:hypothetical protein